MIESAFLAVPKTLDNAFGFVEDSLCRRHVDPLPIAVAIARVVGEHPSPPFHKPLENESYESLRSQRAAT
jgi:hypothetical protein